MKSLTKISLIGVISCSLMGTVFADYYNSPANNYYTSPSSNYDSSSYNTPSDTSNYSNSNYTTSPSNNSMNPPNAYPITSLTKMSKSDLLTSLTPENKAFYDKMGKKGQDLALKLLNNECTTPDACDGFYYGPVRDANEAVRVAYEAMRSNPPSSTPSTQKLPQ